jgi:ankyrin repeat protein
LWQSIISATHCFCQVAAEARIRESDSNSIICAIYDRNIKLVEDFVTADRSIVLKDDYDDWLGRNTLPLNCAIAAHGRPDWHIDFESRERASRSFEIIFFLINSKADVNARECVGDKRFCPLSLACEYGDLNVCRLLVESKADVAATNVLDSNGTLATTLYLAIHEYDHYEIIHYLRSIGAPSCYLQESPHCDVVEEHEHSFAHTCQFQSHRPW